MGRQISVALTQKDEEEFISFLRQSADIQIIRSFAETDEGLFVTNFGVRESGNWTLDIWNKAFPWKPEYAKTRLDLPEDRRNLSYISNKNDAPLIEYTRHNFNLGGVAGRIYWAKNFAAPNGLSYDVKGFEDWYESVVRWLRKNKKKNHAL